jgi:hypothetical protein
MTAVATEPQQPNLSRAVADGFRLIGRHPTTILILAALLVLPAEAILAWTDGNAAPSAAQGPTALAEVWGHAGIRIAVVYAAGGVEWMFLGAVATLAAADARSRDGFDDALPPIFGLRSASLFLAGVVTNILISLGTLALFVPGIMMGLAWCVGPAVAAVEGHGLSAVYRRSADLTRGHRGALMGFFIGFFLVRGAFTYGPRLALGLPWATLYVGPDWLVYGVRPAVSTGLGVVYAAVMGCVYLELRRLHEGGLAATFD